MILKDQLYNITNRASVDDSTVITVKLNPECFIYKAHFPGNPITPGVCIVQSASELLGEITGKSLEIAEAKDIRFLNILSPKDGQTADFVFTGITQEDGKVKAQVNVKSDTESFATISFTCVEK